jgi:adenine-specific DNA-methyltransferase
LVLRLRQIEPTLFTDILPGRFPSTRYQGSKRKLLPWIAPLLRDLEFDSALDAMSGTAAVAYLFKQMGKQVMANDRLQANIEIALALIENPGEKLGDHDLEQVMQRRPGIVYDRFIEETFSGIYFTNEENGWLDVVAQNISRLRNPYRRALLRFALFQACLAKRPYNLFHRRNLELRLREVKRGFGNKATWDRPFPDHFRHFAQEANAAVFDNGRKNRALCGDALLAAGRFDLVYLDPPYLRADGAGADYPGFYHFLEGLCDYPRWPERLDRASLHLRLRPEPDPWLSAEGARENFRRLIERFRESILVVSYRSDGIPSEGELVSMLESIGKRVQVFRASPRPYALSRNRASQDVLFIAR